MKDDKELMEIISRVQTDLYFFYRMVVTSKFEKNLRAAHIHKLSKELMRMYRGDFQKLCVAMPPRHSKSSLITIAYPLWLLFNNPNLNIVIVNNTATLSEKFGIALREYVKEWGTVFNFKLSDIKHSNSHLMFTNNEGKLYNGSIRLIGANGSITGQDCDYIILDDIYKGTADDLTPTALQKKIDWFNQIVMQRVEPQTRLILLHIRWAENDLIGYLKKNYSHEYKIIEYPALLENGTPLWKEKYNGGEELQKIREQIGERLFECIYQQKPLDQTSDFFKIEHLKFGLPPNYNPGASVRCWDIAYGDGVGDSDYTVGVKMIKSNDDYVIIDIIRGRFGNNTKNIILQTAKDDTPNTKIKIETGVGASAKLLYNEWSQMLRGFYLEELKPISSKVDRATPLKHSIYDKKIWINITDDIARENIMQELKSFPNGAHDDIIDAMSYCYTDLHNNEIQTMGLGIVQI